MTLWQITDLGLLVIGVLIGLMALVLGAYITYRMCKIEAKLDRICEALGVEEEEEAYRHQHA